MTGITAAQFSEKWKRSKLRERQAAQEQFIDLCRLLDHPTPAEADSAGEAFCFDKGARKPDGSDGWADVWKRGHFGWEYKGKRKDLDDAYKQLCLYRDALENPPLLVVSDMERFVVRTNFNDTIQEVRELSLDDFLEPQKLTVLRYAFHEPERLRPTLTREALTHGVAAEFSRLAERLAERYGHAERPRVAHFVNRLVFCMFAEDIGLLPDKIFQRTVEAALNAPQDFSSMASGLFRTMATGGRFDLAKIEHFNGSLFDNDEAFDLTREDLKIVLQAAQKNWADIDPTIFGTLFEQGVDPVRREELGTHYTRPERIQRIVDTVIVRPLAAEWEANKKTIAAKLAEADRTLEGTKAEVVGTDKALTEEVLKRRSAARKKTKSARDKAARLRREAERLYKRFLARVRTYRVLDPACGSGNFLYLALIALKNLEHQAGIDSEQFGLARQFPEVGPECILGIEKSEYAAELARVTVWIGELQWMKRYGYAIGRRPILRSLDNILLGDAIITAEGEEPTWLEADAIIGNPPFKGDRWMTASLGRDYVKALHSLYNGRVPKSANQVLYWFEKARAQVVEGRTKRVGLVATSTIRNPNNRPVLARVIEETDVFAVWPNEEWYVPAPGAPRREASAVRVAMVCFATMGEGDNPILLKGVPVAAINPDFSSGLDLTRAVMLPENANIAFQGAIPWGEDFVVSGEIARHWLEEGGNPNGRPNSDVLWQYPIARDITDRPRDEWIIDFGDMSEREASLYESPFRHVHTHVRPKRLGASQKKARDLWWQLWNPRHKYRSA